MEKRIQRSFRYEEIADDLRRQIQQGEYGAHRLPSERILMEKFGVQRDTIRRALSVVEAEGLIVTERKRGSFLVPGAAILAPRAAETGPPAKAALQSAGAILVVTAQNDASTARESILRGLSQALVSTPHSILYFNSRPKPGHVDHRIPSPEYLAANQVAGVVLWPQNPTDLKQLRQLRAAVPLVLVDRRIPGFESDCLGFDDVAGGRMLTEHLLRQGHRRIGFFGDEAFAETVQQRWRGYNLALEAAGIPLDSACVALSNGMRNPPLNDYLRLLLAADGQPLTAVVCSNDSDAMIMLRFLRSMGLRVPEDVAITGYGNLVPDYLDALELTTAAQPFEELGRMAGAILLERIAEQATGATPSPFQEIELPVSLIQRNSSRKTIVG